MEMTTTADCVTRHYIRIPYLQTVRDIYMLND